MTLLHKGLIVISFPLLCQLIFFAYYSHQVKEAEFLVDQEYRQKQVIGRVNYMSALIASAQLAYETKAITSAPEFEQIYMDCRSKISAEINQMKQLVGDAPQIALLDRIDLLCNRLFDLCSNNQDHLVLQNIRENKEQLYSVWLKLFESRRLLLDSEIRRFKTNSESIPAQRQLSEQFIVAGISLSIALALGLLYLYNKAVTSRLSVLIENTKRVSRHEDLRERLGGTDEVSELDDLFHNMVASLRESEMEKQQVLAMISHDLRTPLTSVLAKYELVEGGYCGTISAEAKQVLNSAGANIQMLLNLIQELLDVERMSSRTLIMEYRKFPSELFVRNSIAQVCPLAEAKNIRIIEPESDFFIVADQDRLTRVLTNLLTNAIKFAPDESKVTVELAQESDSFTVSVTDEGAGIPPSELKQIFERYHQISQSDSKGGVGLGLAICKLIVEAHHGTIGVISSEGKGSTFWFRLPAKN